MDCRAGYLLGYLDTPLGHSAWLPVIENVFSDLLGGGERTRKVGRRQQFRILPPGIIGLGFVRNMGEVAILTGCSPLHTKNKKAEIG